MTLLPNVDAQVYISMDGSGDFDGPNDRVTPYTHYQRGIEVSEGRDGAQQLNPPKINTGGFDLKNDRGRFSPDNPGSPVYQQLIPSRPVLFTISHGVRRLWRDHFLYRDRVPWRGKALYSAGRHVVEDIGQATEIGSRRVNIETISYETMLTRAPVTVPMMTNPLVSECFSALLDAVSWPTDKRSIAISDTRLLRWWCDERHPWDAMLELLASEGPGTFYVSFDGVFHFENRNFRSANTRSTTSQATLYDRIAGQRTAYRSHVLWRDHRLYRGRVTGMAYSNLMPTSVYKNIYNRATYTTRRRTTATLGKIYEYGATLTLGANQSFTIFVRPTDPFTGAVNPQVGTDYQLTSGTAVVTLTYSSGFLAIINIVAGAGGATIDGVTSSGIQLRAQSLTLVSETTMQNQTDASESIATFSPIPGQNIPITYQVQGWPEIEPVVAQAVADSWVLRYMNPRPSLTLTISPGDGDSLYALLRFRISDRITLHHQNTGLSGDFWINSRSLHVYGAQGRIVDSVIGLELCDTLSGAIWDHDLWNDPAAVWGV